jgi:hypothetical protein
MSNLMEEHQQSGNFDKKGRETLHKPRTRLRHFAHLIQRPLNLSQPFHRHTSTLDFCDPLQIKALVTSFPECHT